jgi:hypothetical protein
MGCKDVWDHEMVCANCGQQYFDILTSRQCLLELESSGLPHTIRCMGTFVGHQVLDNTVGAHPLVNALVYRGLSGH